MKPWISALGVGVILVAGGGGYYIAHQKAEEALKTVTLKIQESLGPTGSFKYHSSSTSLWSHSVHLDDVELVTKTQMKVHMDSLDVKPSGQNAIDDFVGKNIHMYRDNEPKNINIASLTLHDVTMAPDAVQKDDQGNWKVHPDKFTVGKWDIENIVLSIGDQQYYSLAHWEGKNYGLGKLTDTYMKDIRINSLNENDNKDNKKTSSATIAQMSMRNVDIASFYQGIGQEQVQFAEFFKIPENTTKNITIDGIVLLDETKKPFAQLKQASLNFTAINKTDIKCKTHIDNLILDLSDNESLKQTLQTDNTRLDMSFDQDSYFTADKNKIDTWNGKITVKDWFEVNYSTTRSGFWIQDAIDSLDLLYQLKNSNSYEMRDKYLEALINKKEKRDALLVSGKVNYQDLGMINKIFDIIAKKAGSQSEDMKNYFVATMPFYANMVKANDQNLGNKFEQYLQALGKVIKDPSRNLTIELNPKKPISKDTIIEQIDQLQSNYDYSKLNAFLDELGVTVQAGQPH